VSPADPAQPHPRRASPSPSPPARRPPQRNNYSSGRNEDRLLNPNGGNIEQQWKAESETGAHRSDALPYIGSDATYNMNSMLLENIRSTDYFKGLAVIREWDVLLDNIAYDVKPEYGCTPWLPGTHKGAKAVGMCSGLRGVANAGKPTTAFILLAKMLTMRPTEAQLREALRSEESPYIRALALYLLRYVCEPKQLLAWFRPHLADDEPIQLLGGHPPLPPPTTIGQLARTLLRSLEFYGTRLPRLPVLVMREVEAALEPWALDDRAAERAAAYADDDEKASAAGGGGRRPTSPEARGEREYRRADDDDARARRPYADRARGDGERAGGRYAERDDHRGVTQRDDDRGGGGARGGRGGGGYGYGERAHGDERGRGYERGYDRGYDRERERERDYGGGGGGGGGGRERERESRADGDWKRRDEPLPLPPRGPPPRYDDMRDRSARPPPPPPAPVERIARPTPAAGSAARAEAPAVGGARTSGLSAGEQLDRLRALLSQKTGAVGGPSSVGGDYLPAKSRY
jgi:pre-mRNA-splicing factor 38B